jgi:RHS repeat-associated protein
MQSIKQNSEGGFVAQSRSQYPQFALALGGIVLAEGRSPLVHGEACKAVHKPRHLALRRIPAMPAQLYEMVCVLDQNARSPSNAKISVARTVALFAQHLLVVASIMLAVPSCSTGDEPEVERSKQALSAASPARCPDYDIECQMGLAHSPTGAPEEITLQAPRAPASQPIAGSEVVTPGAQAIPGNAQFAADTLPGQLSVSDSGRATYALPLQLPIGINSMVPGLQLHYNSTRTNGIIGPGWQLTGFSSIGRCVLTNGQDDLAAPVSDTAADRFCLDGKRLVAIQGAYGADGTEYRTEIESFTRVFSRGNPGGGASYTGPVSFEVWTPDGQIAQYGTGTGTTELQGTVRRTWGISQMRDRFNNTVAFTYTTSFCERPEPSEPPICFGSGLVPNEILYGAHVAGGATDPVVTSDRKVRFVYGTDRPDWGSSFERGVVRLLRHRLDRIDAIVGGSTAWSYHLRYEVAGGVSRMVGVARCAGTAPPLCTPESVFTYASTGQGVARAPAIGAAVSGDFGNGPSSRLTGRTVVLDLNGDGRDDIVTPRFSFTNAGGISFFTYRILLAQAVGPPLASGIDTGIASGDDAAPNPVYPCFGQESVVDFNRDGKDDLVDLCMHPSFGWRVWLSSGSNFTPQPLPFLPQLFSTTPLHVADLDGDGWFDFLTCEGSGTTTHHALYRNRGGTDGFFPARAMPQIGRDCDKTPEVLLDVDGDGVVNVFRPVRNPHQEHFEFFQTFEVAPPWQALVITPTTAAWVDVPMTSFPPRWVSPGALLPPNDEFSYNIEFPPQGRPVVTPLAPLWQFKVVDYNGDGLSDLLTFQGDAPTGPNRTTLYVNTGAGFQRSPFALGQAFSLDNYAFYRTVVTDWDGDGRQDLLIPVGLPRQSPQMVLFRAVGRGGPFVPTVLGGTLYERSMPVTADIDGDGDSDLLIPESEAALSIIFATTNVDHLVKVVEDGLGKREQIHYALSPGNSSAAYSFTTDCRTRHTECARRMSPLVAQTDVLQRTVSQVGTASYPLVRRSSYTYQNARAGFYGRGALGLARISRFDDEPQGRLADTVTTTFDNSTFQDTLAGTSARRWYPFAGQALQVTTTHGSVTDLADLPLVRVDSVTHGPLALQLSADARPFTVVPQTFQQTSEGAPGQAGQILLHTTTTRSFDGYGNQLLETVASRNGGNELLESRSTSSTFTTDAAGRASWLIRCPLRIAESSTVGAETLTQVVLHAPCLAPGVPTQITREPTSNDAGIFLDVAFQHDRFGNLTRMSAADLSGAVGRSVAYAYDARGLTLTQLTQGDLLVTGFAHDVVHGGVVTETAPNGVTVTASYDALARPISAVSPDGTTVFSYETPTQASLDPLVASTGRMRLRVTEPGGEQRESILDALGRTVQTRSTGYLGQIVTREQLYDHAGRSVFRSALHVPGDTQQGSTTFEYDRLGRLRFERRTDESAAGGIAITQTRYGPATQADRSLWNATTRTHAIAAMQRTLSSGGVEVYGLGRDGDPVVARDALGGVTQYVPRAFGLIGQIRDPAGNVTTFQYDVLGRRIAVADPNSGTETTTYDAYDAPRTTSDAVGTSSFGYDVLGRLLERSEADGSAQTFRYDGGGVSQGQLVEAIARNASRIPTTRTTYEYRPAASAGAGKISRISRTIGDVVFDTRMDFDSTGRLDTLQYPAIDGKVFAVRHRYDAHGHLTSVVNAETEEAYWTFVAADQGYRIGRERFGDGTETVHTYQAQAGRVSGLETRRIASATALQKLTFGYDSRLELSTRSDASDPTRSRTYEHDLLGRLTRVVQGGGTPTELARFTYNSIGNFTSSKSLGSYTYEASRPHAVTRAGANTYGYDARGNQIVRTGPAVAGRVQQIEYTPFNLPVRITTGTGLEQHVVDYLYDADQRRVHTRTSAGVETWHIGEIYEREQTPREITHRYRVYGPSRVVVEIASEQTAPQQPVTDGGKRYIHPDALGSPDLVTDGAGAVLARPEFDPFGKQSVALPGVVTGFTGHRQEELGLIDMRGRFYDPVLCRFLTPDPVIANPLSSQSLNRYSYVANRPLRLSDPSGWQPVTQPWEVEGPITRPSQTEAPRRRGTVEGPFFCDSLPCDLSTAKTIITGPGTDGPGTDGPGTDGPGADGSSQAPSPGTAGTASGGSSGSGSGNGGGVGRGGGAQPAGAGMAIAASAAGLTVGVGTAYGIAYSLGALSVVCLPCAIGIGVALVAGAVYSLVDGGAESLYDSGNRIVHGNGTAGDFFSASSAVGSLAGGGVAGRAYSSGRSRALAFFPSRATGAAPAAVHPNTLHHIFGKPAHNLGPLLAEFGGSREAAGAAIAAATEAAVKAAGITGVYRDLVVSVRGRQVFVRGAVVDGIVRLSTAFIP